MFLTILNLFVCLIMKYSLTFCFARVRKKRENKQKRSKKVEKSSSLCRDTIFICLDTKFKQAKGNMSQLTTECHNKAQTKLNGRRRNFVATKNFSITTLLKKIMKETVAKILYSVTTKIKTESKEAVSRQYNLCSNMTS